MKVELDVGEAVVITFAGTDGEITVAFADKDIRILTGCRADLAAELQELGGITVHVDLADVSGREGVIYHEPLGTPDERVGKVERPSDYNDWK